MAKSSLQAAVAAHLDISQARVAQFVKEGVFTKTTDGKLDLTGCRIAYIRWLRDESRHNSHSAAARRVQDARAREIEIRVNDKLKIQERAGQQAAIDAIDEMFLPLRNNLLSIPARATVDLVTRRKIEDLIEAAIAATGERAQAMADSIAAGEPAGQRPAVEASKARRHLKSKAPLN